MLRSHYGAREKDVCLGHAVKPGGWPILEPNTLAPRATGSHLRRSSIPSPYTVSTRTSASENLAKSGHCWCLARDMRAAEPGVQYGGTLHSLKRVRCTLVAHLHHTHTHTQGGARQYACALLDAPSIHMVPVCFAIAADARSQSMSLFPAPRCLHPKPATPFADYYLDAQEPGMEQLSVHCLYRPSQSFPSW